jgi:hypothetical protein
VAVSQAVQSDLAAESLHEIRNGMRKTARLHAGSILSENDQPIASRYVERPTNVGWSSRSVSTVPSSNDRRYLRKGITATFCNVPTAPNTNGYGSGGGLGSSGGAGSNTSSIPPCPDFPPVNELCN